MKPGFPQPLPHLPVASSTLALAGAEFPPPPQKKKVRWKLRQAGQRVGRVGFTPCWPRLMWTHTHLDHISEDSLAPHAKRPTTNPGYTHVFTNKVFTHTPPPGGRGVFTTS